MSVLILLNIVSLVRTIVIIAIVYYAIKIFARLVLPSMVQKGVKNMQQKMYDQYRNQQSDFRKEGEVTIEKNRGSKLNTDPGKGEYVDFEEVD